MTIHNETLLQQIDSLLQYGRDHEVNEDGDLFWHILVSMFLIVDMFAWFLDVFLRISDIFGLSQATFDT